MTGTGSYQSQIFLGVGYFNTTNQSFNGVNSTTAVIGYKKYISDEAFTYIIISVLTVTTGLISILGIAANTINIIVFIRQGVFSDSSTVSLFGLAIADLLSVVTTLWAGVFYALGLLGPSDLTFDPFDILDMGGGWPHVVSGLITRTITALISFERCFCVVFPFKVKNVFTPKSSSILVSSIFAFFILSFSPVYVLNTFHHVSDPETNRSHLILVEDPLWPLVQTVLSNASLFTFNFLPVVMVTVCTTITVSRVNLSSEWRESMSTTNHGNHGNTKSKPKQLPETITETEFDSNLGHRETSTSKSPQSQPHKLSNSKKQKEKKVVRMITCICLIFLVCYMPSAATPVIYNYDREIRTNGGVYKNLAWCIYCICWCFDAINSTVNIFIYYKMSSRYKKEFNALFGLSVK